MEDGRYRIEIELEDGRTYEFSFWLLTHLYASPRQVRQELRSIVQGLSDEEIALTLWQVCLDIDELARQMNLSEEEMEDRVYARSRYALYRTCTTILRRHLYEMAAFPTRESRKLGDTQVAIERSPELLERALDLLERQEQSWLSALFGGALAKGAVRGGQVAEYPLEGRVW